MENNKCIGCEYLINSHEKADKFNVENEEHHFVELIDKLTTEKIGYNHCGYYKTPVHVCYSICNK